MKMKTFAHTGDLGDLILALPTIKAIGGGELYLFPDSNVREPFTLNRAYNIGNLLMHQSYIRSWTLLSQPVRDEFDYDFREWRAAYNGSDNIAYSQAAHFGLPPSVCDEPWLTVDPVTIAPVVVCRSHRYRQHDFPWLDIAERYRDEAMVLGIKSEFEELQYLYGFNRYAPTPTMLEMARVIAGADLVVTNQTAAHAIAEGLKKPAVLLERWEAYPNVDFAREGVYTGERVAEYLAAHPKAAAPVAAPRIMGTRAPVAVA
jgi:hypothetical protein